MSVLDGTEYVGLTTESILKWTKLMGEDIGL
jgi:hypothetical protein